MILRVIYSENRQQAILESLEKLCSVFWGPNLENCRAVLSDGYLAPFESLDDTLGHNAMITLKNIRRILLDFSNAESFFNSLEETYVRLFINDRGGIAAPLYHSCYLNSTQSNASPVIMGDTAVYMQERFESKGLSISSAIHEPPDHLAVEIEYLYFLLQKGWENQNQAYLEEAASFAGTFMLPWVTLFYERLQNEPGGLFYALSAALLKLELHLISSLGTRNATLF